MVFFKAGAQNVPRLAECLRDAHKFLTITQVTLSRHEAALWAAHGHLSVLRNHQKHHLSQSPRPNETAKRTE